jgi:vacuolar-type H+-ATPase subunit I/STV1
MEQTMQKVHDEMRKFNTEMDNWCGENENRVRQIETQHEVHIHDSNTTLDSLKDERKALETLNLQQNERVTQEKTQIDSIEKSIVQLQKQTDVLPAQASELEAAEAEKQVATQESQSNIEELRVETRRTIQELTKGLEFFKRLGLGLTPVNDAITGGAVGLRIDFTCINPNDASQCFSFMTSISDEEQYVITDLSHPVPQLQAYVEQLNQQNGDDALSRFLQLMRRAFQAPFLAK